MFVGETLFWHFANNPFICSNVVVVQTVTCIGAGTKMSANNFQQQHTWKDGTISISLVHDVKKHVSSRGFAHGEEELTAAREPNGAGAKMLEWWAFLTRIHPKKPKETPNVSMK